MSSMLSPRDNEATVEMIRAIPDAMRQMGWHVSAALMDRWLRTPAWSMPEWWKGKYGPDPRVIAASQVDNRIVRAAWAMSRPRMREKVIELRGKMANTPAREELRRKLSELPWGSRTRLTFGSRGDDALTLDRTCQSNSVRAGSPMDTMDDMYGALGRFTVKVALIGEATRTGHGKFSLKVTDAGFYIRDTYDFNGPQFLGVWSRSGALGKVKTAMNVVGNGLTFQWGRPAGHVSNEDFDVYRRATGFGGDFIVYSDVIWESANMTVDLG